jgi:hypothetical protein
MSENREDPRWAFVDRIPLPWARRLYQHIPRHKIPILSGDTLLVGTDTSGSQRGSRYTVLGIFIMDAAGSPRWNADRLLIRERFLNDGRRMSYKNLNDGRRRSALVPFLEVADQVRGICFLTAFDKRLGSLCSAPEIYERSRREGIIGANWKSNSFEHMMRTVHMVSSIVAAVCVKDQNVYWISDLDECFATEDRKTDTARMLSAFTTAYVGHTLGELGVGTTEIDEGDRLEEDLTAVPDLAAGAICDLLNRMHEHHGTYPLIPTLVPSLKGKTETISDWFFSNRGRLHKLACIVRFVASGHMQVGVFRTESEGKVVPAL